MHGQLSVSVAENGRGFEGRTPCAGSAPPVGLGLGSMHARAQRLGGTLAIDAGAQGTTLALQLSLEPVPSPAA